MNKITKITKRNVIDLFKNGYEEHHWLIGDDEYSYPYHGRVKEIDFLKKLYPLDKMPSNDSRFKNAEEDIYQHTINNDDWENNWVFEDSRFELLNGDDKIFLDFLCAVFHPEYRIENGCWKEYLKRINSFLKVDGYELYEKERISGRYIYSYRKLTNEEIISDNLIPFSIRKKDEIIT